MENRVRQRNNLTTNIRNWSLWSYTSASCTSSPSWSMSASGTSNEVTGTFEEMRDVVTPDFNRLRRSGQVVFNPMSYRKLTLGAASGSTATNDDNSMSCTNAGETTYRKSWQFLGGGPSVFNRFGQSSNSSVSSILDPTDQSALLGEVTTSCLSARGRGGTNLFESIAEADDALRTVPDIVKGAIKAANKNAKFLKRARDVGGVYLAYRYGLKPTMSDLAAVASAVASASNRVRETSRAQGQISGSQTFSGPLVNLAAMQLVQTQLTISESYSVRAMALDEFYSSVAYKSGLTAKNLVTVPWELVPYSFVVDWFVNVGDYFGALVPFLGATALGSTYTVTSERLLTASVASVSSASGSQHIAGAFSGSRTISELNRSRVVGLPAPVLGVKTDFRLSNATRAADAISLLVQHLHHF